ncbi:phosphotransferase family protein [Streptomyces sp. NPDC055078]
MPATRTAFEELPSSVLAAIEGHMGRVHRAEAVAEGLNSHLAARIHTDTGGCHVKGLRSDHRWAWTQRREAEVNPYLKGISPELLWRIEESGWDILGFELLNGRHADYESESPDLPKVADLLRRLGEAPCPDIELRRAEQRLEAYVDNPAHLEYFAGNSLLHTDLNHENVIVQSGVAYLVDWAWATRGAAWLDAGYWVIWLMAVGGHSQEQAESWAGRIPAWRKAPSEGINAFAAANAHLWAEVGGAEPDAWTARMITASRYWAQYRKKLSA